MTLFAFERGWAEAIGRALIPPASLDGVTRGVDAGRAYEEDVAASPWYVALLLRGALWLAWFAPLLWRYRWRTFGGLCDEERVEILERMLAARPYLVRTTALFLKLTVCGAILGDVKVMRRLQAYAAEGAPRPLSLPPPREPSP